MRRNRRIGLADRFGGIGAVIVAVMLALACTASRGRAAAQQAGPGQTARMRVDGLGWLGDRQMHQTLLLLSGQAPGPTVDANAMEDAAMIVFSRLEETGYLEPVIEVEARLADGTTARHSLGPKLDQPLPRPLVSADVILHVHSGRRFVLSDVTFEGLTAVGEKDARVFFRGENALFSIGAERAYSPARLQRSASNLTEELHRRGYAGAQVDAGDVRIDAATGDVRVRVVVTEGPLWRVTGFKFAPGNEGAVPTGLEAGRLGRPWSLLWRQDMEVAIRRWYYERGHPDVKVTLTPQAADAVGGVRTVTVVAAIVPGPAVTLAGVRFAGNERTRESILRPLVPAKAGDPLNPLEMENGQVRISHLGVFNAVDLRYEPADGPEREAVYQLAEGKRRDLSLLFGYGSYEQLRGGFEERDYNLFGRAHQGTLELVQSMKGTSGEYDYNVPELFGSSVDGTAKVFGLQRQERSFLREEDGANVSATWPLPKLGIEATTGYTYKLLRSADSSLATSAIDLVKTNAASLNLGLTRDRRDNPLVPKRGYKLSLQLEEASRWLGGQVDYQRLQFAASYHRPLGSSLWFHAGFTHSVVTTLGSLDDSELPVNERFYPGGDTTIRGYPEGEAAPRAASGQFLGAKTMTLLNLELEEAVTPKWSVVVFSDSLGMAARMAHYPFDERLYAVGLGVRYQTLIGPVRLEYGRNLNPRPLDPSGTVSFSIGFPF